MHPPVEHEIYQQIGEAVSHDFAFSYLIKAVQVGKDVHPFTVTAHDRLKASRPAMEVFRRHGVRLRKPEPYHEHRRFLGGPANHPAQPKDEAA